MNRNIITYSNDGERASARRDARFFVVCLMLCLYGWLSTLYSRSALFSILKHVVSFLRSRSLLRQTGRLRRVWCDFPRFPQECWWDWHEPLRYSAPWLASWVSRRALCSFAGIIARLARQRRLGMACRRSHLPSDFLRVVLHNAALFTRAVRFPCLCTAVFLREYGCTSRELCRTPFPCLRPKWRRPVSISTAIVIS
jgi:hypothetical protein